MLSERETKCLLEARLRNLKRTYSKLINHHDLIDESIEVKHLINETRDKLRILEATE